MGVLMNEKKTGFCSRNNFKGVITGGELERPPAIRNDQVFCAGTLGNSKKCEGDKKSIKGVKHCQPWI
jgi:hypothetical protein